MKIAMDVFRVRKPYLMHDVYTNDSLHGVCFPTVNIGEIRMFMRVFKSNEMSTGSDILIIL